MNFKKHYHEAHQSTLNVFSENFLSHPNYIVAPLGPSESQYCLYSQFKATALVHIFTELALKTRGTTGQKISAQMNARTVKILYAFFFF